MFALKRKLRFGVIENSPVDIFPAGRAVAVGAAARKLPPVDVLVAVGAVAMI